MQAAGGSLIGPNAVLQCAAAMEQQLGPNRSREILRLAGIAALPDGRTMIAEADAIQLHRTLAAEAPGMAAAIAAEAGARTADYIIAHRIPRAAAKLLPLLPAWLGARLLMRAIAHHAWTFVGAGRFAPLGPWQFVIDRAQAGDREPPAPTLFIWYGAVFARLFQTLVAPGCTCRDAGAPAGPGLVHRYRIDRAPGGAAVSGRAPAPGLPHSA